MKQNLYTIPEGFFEDFEHRVQQRTARIRHQFIAVLCLCPLLLGTGIYFGFSSIGNDRIESCARDINSENCDIFLELFE